MMTVRPSPLLRQALLADASTSAAFGLLMLIAAGLLGHLLGLPDMLLRMSGAVLLPYAGFLAYLGLRETAERLCGGSLTPSDGCQECGSALS